MSDHLFGKPPKSIDFQLPSNNIDDFAQFEEILPKRQFFLQYGDNGYYCDYEDMERSEASLLAYYFFGDCKTSIEQIEELIENTSLTILDAPVNLWHKYHDLEWWGSLLDMPVYFTTEKDVGTLLWLAAYFERSDILNFLIKKGCNVNLKNGYHSTALTYAIYHKQEDAVEFLINAGADITLNENYCEFDNNVYASATDHLALAINSENLKIINMVLKDSSKYSNEHLNRLFRQMVESTSFHMEIMDLAIQHGARVNPRESCTGYGVPLILAANYKEKVEYLLKKGADPNFVSEEGDTPIFQAISFQNLDSIRLLLDAGADLNHVGRKGLNPIAYAMQKDRPFAARLLFEHIRS